MSAEISISINKNKKKFKPQLSKRKRTSKPVLEGNNTSHEKQEPAKTNEPLPNTVRPTKRDYLESQMPSPELIQELIHLYPQTVQKVNKRFKCTQPKEYIPQDLPTAEDRRKQLDVIREPLLNETQKIIRERERREQGSGLTDSALAPQVKLVNGKIVLDEDTLQVCRSDPKYIDMTTDSLMKNQELGLRSPWTPLETQVFYDGLSKYGLDFERIANTLIGRTRRGVVLKYHREETCYPEKVAKYLFKPAGKV
ncbi:hypothetical protein BDF21DRAFT_408505 [Thamnidium elegans]|nr:hypothetical protein BDF21DRAFT_408505 [Thamnidium elegans]